MKLYVSNMLFTLTEEDVHRAFSKFGKVESVNIIKDKENGRSRGFGFVVMGSASEGQAAIAGLNDTEIGGRMIRVAEAQSRPENTARKKTSAGGGGNKGGGRGGKGGFHGGQGGSRGGRNGGPGGQGRDR